MQAAELEGWPFYAVTYGALAAACSAAILVSPAGHVAWLAGGLAGWLAGCWLARWLAGWLAMQQPRLSLPWRSRFCLPHV